MSKKSSATNAERRVFKKRHKQIMGAVTDKPPRGPKKKSK